MSEYDRVLNLLENVRGSGDQVMASCPVHGEDKHPSLRVYRKSDGGAGFYCFAGCDFRDVRAALGLPTSPKKAIMTEEERIAAQKRRQKEQMLRAAARKRVTDELARRRPDLSYHSQVDKGMAYINSHWQLTRQIVDELRIGYCSAAPLYSRSPSITFPYYTTDGRLVRIAHRLINPGAKGKYLPESADMPRALYNAPALNDSGDIFLVEGEAKTAHLYQYLPAVGVAGKNGFDPDWAPLFCGRRVYITYDPDALDEAYRDAKIIAAAGGLAYVLSLPDKVDDMLIEHGGDGLTMLMNARESARRVYFNVVNNKIETLSGGNRSYWASKFIAPRTPSYNSL